MFYKTLNTHLLRGTTNIGNDNINNKNEKIRNLGNFLFTEQQCDECRIKHRQEPKALNIYGAHSMFWSYRISF